LPIKGKGSLFNKSLVWNENDTGYKLQVTGSALAFSLKPKTCNLQLL